MWSWMAGRAFQKLIDQGARLESKEGEKLVKERMEASELNFD